jgi:hypothetical protein
MSARKDTSSWAEGGGRTSRDRPARGGLKRAARPFQTPGVPPARVYRLFAAALAAPGLL